MNCNKELHNKLSDIGEISCPFCDKILDSICNDELHVSLSESGDIVCHFCDQKLEDSDEKPQDRLAKYDLCCDKQDVFNNNGMLVCRSCGIVQGYETAREYIDFYENKYRMKRKSVYHRKYHVNNILMDITSKYKITFSVDQKNKILRIFAEIDKIFPQINGERKRIVSVYFILIKIFKMLGIESNKLPITKSKKTLAFYNEYWAKIMSLIGDKMKEIINK